MIRSCLAALTALLLTLGGVPGAVVAQQAPPEHIRSQLPVPPAGFEWRMHKNALFLKPGGWNEGSKAQQGSAYPATLYSTSPQEVAQGKSFQLALSVLILSGFGDVYGISAERMITEYVGRITKRREARDILLNEQEDQPPYKMALVRYRNEKSGAAPSIVHNFVLANGSKDSMHVFIFESPEADWEANWERFGRPILSNVHVLAELPAN